MGKSLSEWCDARGRGAMADLARESGVSYQTIQKVATHGQRVVRYDVAKAISDATGGEVTVKDLCEPVNGGDMPLSVAPAAGAAE